MVKFEKNKMKKLNKIEKKQISATAATNKVLKKKLNNEKKVAFKNKVLLKETVKDENLVKFVSKTDVELQNLFKKAENSEPQPKNAVEKKPKIKAVEKQKKRQKMQVNDTKLLLNLMKKSLK